MFSSIKGLSIKDLNILCTYLLIFREDSGCFLQAVGSWLLAIGCWLLANGC
jgi:hypothetical protein